MSNSGGCSCIAEARRVDFAFQPIISTTSLQVHGFEALARLPGSRFTNIHELLNCAYAGGSLRSVEFVLLRSAIKKFSAFPDNGQVRLFCNVDNRAYEGARPDLDALLDLIEHSGMSPSQLCLEISEREQMGSMENFHEVSKTLLSRDARIALDDFGIGNSGLHMLMHVEPNYVKIDQSFILDIAHNSRKQAIVAKLCGLAHALGFLTVAEGIENEADFRTARDLGCQLAQGYHIARPNTDLSQLTVAYANTLSTVQTQEMSPRVAELLSPVKPVFADLPLAEAVSPFSTQRTLRLLPVVDRQNSLLGAVYEEDAREFMLSDYGRSLLANKGMDVKIGKLTRRCPTAEANGTVEAIVNSYVMAESALGIVLVEDGKFVGYLSNNSVLRLASEREVNVAREQNPLTKLPGNEAIGRHLENITAMQGQRLLAYLDFANFKAFNDTYGFAAGDRTLLMFAALLRKIERQHGAFVAHLGGDDFFLSMAMEDDTVDVIRQLQRRFADNAESLYSKDHREAGGITAIDRFGLARFFPLLTVSAGVVILPAHRTGLMREELLGKLSKAKTAAKNSEDQLSMVELHAGEDAETIDAPVLGTQKAA